MGGPIAPATNRSQTHPIEQRCNANAKRYLIVALGDHIDSIAVANIL
jgi:hypothetical protein